MPCKGFAPRVTALGPAPYHFTLAGTRRVLGWMFPSGFHEAAPAPRDELPESNATGWGRGEKGYGRCPKPKSRARRACRDPGCAGRPLAGSQSRGGGRLRRLGRRRTELRPSCRRR